MYNELRSRKSVALWMKAISRVKRKHNSPKPSTRPKHFNCVFHLDRMSEVEEIVEELQKKHQSKYSPEQLHAWAHMIQMKKHSSY